MTRFLFIRHGESLANASRCISSLPPGPGLSENGFAQSRELARRSTGLRVAQIYSSPMVRAVQTAKEIAEAHGIPHTVDDDLVEVSVGKAEGMPEDEGMALLSEGWVRWIKEADYASPLAPGGESAVDAMARVRRFLARARKRHPGDERVAVVTHGGLLHLLCFLCENLPDGHGYRNWLRNTESAEFVDGEHGFLCTVWGGLPVDLVPVDSRSAAPDGAV